MNSEVAQDLSEWNKYPSSQYIQSLSETRSDFSRNGRIIRKCPSYQNLNYSNRNIHLEPIPIISDVSATEKKLRFCVNVICHEYTSAFYYFCFDRFSFKRIVLFCLLSSFCILYYFLNKYYTIIIVK